MVCQVQDLQEHSKIVSDEKIKEGETNDFNLKHLLSQQQDHYTQFNQHLKQIICLELMLMLHENSCGPLLPAIFFFNKLTAAQDNAVYTYDL